VNGAGHAHHNKDFGIGKEIAIIFAREAAKVAIADLDQKQPTPLRARSIPLPSEFTTVDHVVETALFSGFVRFERPHRPI